VTFLGNFGNRSPRGTPRENLGTPLAQYPAAPLRGTPPIFPRVPLMAIGRPRRDAANLEQPFTTRFPKRPQSRQEAQRTIMAWAKRSLSKVRYTVTHINPRKEFFKPQMAHFEDPILMVRTLKGAPISCLVAMALAKQSVSHAWLCRHTGYSSHAVTTALALLEDYQLATWSRNRTNWRLTHGAKQLPLGPDLLQTADETTNGFCTAIGEDRENRNLPPAAASLSLSYKDIAEEERKIAKNANFQNLQNVKRHPKRKYPQQKRTVTGRSRPNSVCANLEVFRSFGLMKNDFVLEICKLDHVTPDYILGQKRRLEAEGRYSRGLLLKVVKDDDYLPPHYLNGSFAPASCQITEAEPDPLGEPAPSASPEPQPGPEPDPTALQPIHGDITAASAWQTALEQLQRDMPKVAFDNWVSSSRVTTYQDGTFTIAARSDYARKWMESRLASTVIRLLAGICNRTVHVKFIIPQEQKF
jgi:hypothetical protein